jgi:DNA-binding NtrC family response regulator
MTKTLLCIALHDGMAARAACAALPGWRTEVVDTLADATAALRQHVHHVGLLFCAGEHHAAGLQHLLATCPGMEWIGVFDVAALASPACRELITLHLHDFHTAPVDAPRLAHALGHALGIAALRQQSPGARPDGMDGLVGASHAIASLRQHIRKMARADAPVLISGESGSGKELTALAVHAHSARAGGPFVAINCGAIPAGLIQSELFGHVRGAFTGAARDKAGFIEAAAGGTIFLDEIADLPREMQAILLRFLQEKTIYRVGATRSTAVDVRVVAASHVELATAVAQGAFREDLYYRLAVLPLRVPPLRERKEDLALLATHFFDQFASDRPGRLKGFSRAALQALRAHDWPGNVRELINRTRRALVLAEGRLILPGDLGLAAPASAPLANQTPGLGESRVQAERHAIRCSLERAGGNVSQAARELGVSRMTLYRLLDRHAISHRH